MGFMKKTPTNYNMYIDSFGRVYMSDKFEEELYQTFRIPGDAFTILSIEILKKISSVPKWKRWILKIIFWRNG